MFERINCKEFYNGLILYHIDALAPDVSIIANINAGSLYENRATSGITHLIEHLLFRGTKKRESCRMIERELISMGGINECYTERFYVPFRMRVLSDDVPKALECMSDILYHSHMYSTEIEKEKSIFLVEHAGEYDDPFLCLENKTMELLYRGTKLGWQIIGNEKTICSITKKQINEYYARYFTPANTTLIIAGNIDFCDAVNEVSRHFSGHRKGKAYIIPKIENNHAAGIDMRIGKKLENSYISIALALQPSEREGIALEILAGVFSEELYQKIRNEHALSYQVDADFETNRIYSRFSITANCIPKNYDKTRELLLQEISKARRGKILKNHIEGVIEMTRKEFILNNVKTTGMARTLLSCWLAGNINAARTYLEKLDTLKPREIIDAAEKFLSKNDINIVSVGLFK